MKEKITIIGGGPGGLLLACILSNKYEITLVEKQQNLGGCWRINWNEGFFTEHSPKVAGGKNFEFLMKFLGCKFVPTYQSPLKNFLKKLNFSFLEIIYFILTFILVKLNIFPNIYVSEWFKKPEIHDLSVLIADIPEKVLVYDFINSLTLNPKLYQLENPEEWITKMKNILLNKGVNIKVNTKIESFDEHYSYYYFERIYHDYLICTVPPHTLNEILSNCQPNIRYNWGDIQPILSKSFYSSVGFQLHYKEELPNLFNTPLILKPRKVIAVQTSSYSEFTKRNDIKSVISCTIIDQRASSINEALTEIKKITNIDPEYLTLNDLHFDGTYYISEDTAFIQQKEGIIDYKGKLNNLFLVHSFNKPGISTIDKTLENCYAFLFKF